MKDKVFIISLILLIILGLGWLYQRETDQQSSPTSQEDLKSP